MVTKEVLSRYTEQKQEIEEVRRKIEKIERELDKIEREGMVVDKVKGGEGGIQNYRIEGFPVPEYSRKKTLLYSRKVILSGLEMELCEIVNEIEEFICSIEDSHIRRIISMRYIENLTWAQVADKMGGGNTEDSVRKAFTRFFYTI